VKGVWAGRGPKLVTILVLIVLLGGMTPSLAWNAPAAAAAPDPTGGGPTAPRYFPQTGHYLSGRFRQFWESRGGLFVFGYPLTSQFMFPSTDGNTYQVQYFERAVFEYHPENQPPYDVLLTQMGREAIAGRLADPAFQPAQPSNDPAQTFFAATGHNVGPTFTRWWNQYGGLQSFGFPLSELLTETSQIDGQPYLVQYFERARFEYHPENAGTPYEVLLGQLGRERMNRVNVPATARGPEGSPSLLTATDRTTAAGYPILKGPLVGLGIQAQYYGQPHQKLIGLIQDIGFTWTKQQVVWKDIETSKGQYAWGDLDSIVNDLAAAHINILLTVVKSPAWATATGDDGTPRNPQDLADFMSAISARYKGKVAAYEIWNEENLAAETGDRVDPGAYVQLLKAAYTAVKSVDPNCAIVLGALAPTGVNDPHVAVDDTVYLQQLYAYNNGEVRDYFDALGSHPYGMSNPPETLWSEGKPGPVPKYYDHDSFYFRRFEEQHAVMQQNGDGDKQVWLTEWGWGSDFRPDGYQEFNTVTEDMRADYEVRAIQMMRQRYPWMGVTFLWNLNWSVLDPWYTGPAHYSIINADYSPRPVYNALKALPK
jgi:hypothetical protein